MPFIQLEEVKRAEPIPGFKGRFLHTENMTIADWRIAEGSNFPEHTHPHEQVAFLLEGSFELTMEGETRVLQPGVVAIIPSNIPHRGRALTNCRLMDIFHPVREDFR